MTSPDRASDLITELDRRANPERSRRFSAAQFEVGLQRLESLTAFLVSQPPFLYRPALRISIVGTNGKGTVAFALESLFREAMRDRDPAPVTGLYTSPHLIDFTERIRIDSLPASLLELDGLYRSVNDLIASLPDGLSDGLSSSDRHYKEIFDSLTYFELLTLLGLLLFQSKRTPVQIYEAGLGGRLDATRIARADVVVLTSIGLDHTALLGHTRRRIFEEKIGILSENTQLLFLPEARYERWLAQELLLKLRSHSQRAENRPQSSLHTEERPQILVNPRLADPDYLIAGADYARFIYDTLRVSLALPDLNAFEIPSPPGRRERRQAFGKTWIFDNAHNAPAMFMLLKGLEGLPFAQTAVVLALSADRRPAPILRLIARYRFAHLIVVTGHGLQDVEIEDVRRWTGIDRVSTMPLESAQLADRISEPNVLFMGSHRLYDLFDRETRLRSDEQR
ncbi:MAG: hypothetical protein CVV45_15035 [Spirochaetae bacterium HGW-Spirochaetae-10]|nr:MAG: hypothetical protein CVV45_15035 [Spirochaetae bacterium HGW-Spirochaetae-10]